MTPSCGQRPAAANAGALVARAVDIVGQDNVLTRPADLAPYLRDQRGWFEGRAVLVARPGSTGETAALVSACREAGAGIVAQGGNTGLVGGSVPDESGTQVLLSLSRMNRIRELDAVDGTMTVESGCVLAAVQAAAGAAGLLFPLSLAAEGSCQIGGNLSTNAGGTAVLRYGNARELVLGLEVVLADGRVWNGLRRLRKDNTGYDLKQLFIGSEGTLGIITAAVLKLFPRPRQRHTAFIAVASPAAALRLLAHLRAAAGETVTTYEYINRTSLERALAVAGNRDPLAHAHAHYVLAELCSTRAGDGLREVLEELLAAAVESGDVPDAVLAESGAQAGALWRLRETIPDGIRAWRGGIKHDVSVPVSRMPAFLDHAERAVRERVPGALVFAFGHVGDGNIHFNLGTPPGGDPAVFEAHTAELNRAVNDIACGMQGSFSAEHGIGRVKRADLPRYKSQVEIDLMRALKHALDPEGLMNPGKVL